MPTLAAHEGPSGKEGKFPSLLLEIFWLAERTSLAKTFSSSPQGLGSVLQRRQDSRRVPLLKKKCPQTWRRIVVSGTPAGIFGTVVAGTPIVFESQVSFDNPNFGTCAPVVFRIVAGTEDIVGGASGIGGIVGIAVGRKK